MRVTNQNIKGRSLMLL